MEEFCLAISGELDQYLVVYLLDRKAGRERNITFKLLWRRLTKTSKYSLNKTTELHGVSSTELIYLIFSGMTQILVCI